MMKRYIRIAEDGRHFLAQSIQRRVFGRKAVALPSREVAWQIQSMIPLMRQYDQEKDTKVYKEGQMDVYGLVKLAPPCALRNRLGFQGHTTCTIFSLHTIYAVQQGTV